MSKGYSLAGLRLAYGIGSAALIAPMLNKTKDSYNVDAVAQKLGVAALEDRAYAARSWEHVQQERSRVTRRLAQLGFEVVLSQTNFVLASLPPQSRWSTASALLEELQSRNIYVRWFNEHRLSNRLRISIGTAAENDALLQALE